MTYFENQRGNVLVIILIAVALFAALSYAVSNMMRGGSDIGREKAGIYASEILTYSQSIVEAVHMLRISNGCPDSDISFSSNITAGYDHSPTVSNKCKVFHPSGGGISYQLPISEVNNGLPWIFTGDNDGYNIGSTCNDSSCVDLIAILPDISSKVCKIINKRLDISAANDYMTQENDYFAEVKFQGSYSYTARLSDSSGLQALDGKMHGCVEGKDAPQSAGNYYFYQVLIAR